MTTPPAEAGGPLRRNLWGAPLNVGAPVQVERDAVELRPPLRDDGFAFVEVAGIGPANAAPILLRPDNSLTRRNKEFGRLAGRKRSGFDAVDRNKNSTAAAKCTDVSGHNQRGRCFVGRRLKGKDPRPTGLSCFGLRGWRRSAPCRRKSKCRGAHKSKHPNSRRFGWLRRW